MSNAFVRLEFWLSIVLIGLLFGEWVHVYPFTLRGYDLFEAILEGHGGQVPALYLAWLIPVGLVGTLIACFQNESYRVFPILTAAGTIGPIVYFLVQAQREFGISIEPAGWAAVLAACVLGLSVLFPRRDEGRDLND
jgi:hypothetical protein